MTIVNSSTLKYLVRLLEKNGFDFCASGNGHTIEFSDNCGIIRYPDKNTKLFMAVNNSSYKSRYMVFMMDSQIDGVSELKKKIESIEIADLLTSESNCIFKAGQNLSVWILQ